MDISGLSTPSVILEGRRAAIADAWRRTVSLSAFAGKSMAEVRADFAALTGRVLAVLESEPFDRRSAEAIGVTLVELRYRKPESLSTTIEVLSRELVREIPPGHLDPLLNRVGMVLGALAAGFTRQVMDMLLLEQGRILDALDDERKKVEKAVGWQHEVIVAQTATLKLLSTPLIPVSAGVLVMPLVDTIDAERMRQAMETLLRGISEQKATAVIIDITGVPAVDEESAAALLSIGRAVRLLGARLVLTGIRPNIAWMLVKQGSDLTGIATRRTLESGIAYVTGTR